MTPNQKQLATYAAGNHEAAAIILADPERYPGLTQEWAHLVLSKTGATKTADEKDLPLWRAA